MPVGTTARTGEKCTESGIWKAHGNLSTTAPMAKGKRMPLYDWKVVTWMLIHLLFQVFRPFAYTHSNTKNWI
jgi:hypothetical protein